MLKSASGTPDADWTIGLDASGNVTIAGATGSEFILPWVIPAVTTQKPLVIF